MSTTIAKLSVEEFNNLPEVIGFKSELIEGENVLAPMPLPPHTRVIKNLERILEQQFTDLLVVRESGWRIALPNTSESVPGPDLMVVDPEEYDKAVKASRYFDGFPKFVVEVVSPSERRWRRLQKIGLYLEGGAGAVVEVHYVKRLVLVYRPESEAPEMAHERMTWPFEAALSDVFAGL